MKLLALIITTYILSSCSDSNEDKKMRSVSRPSAENLEQASGSEKIPTATVPKTSDSASIAVDQDIPLPQISLGLGRSNFVWSYEDKVDRRKDRGFADINIMKHAGVKIVRTDMRGFANDVNDTKEADRSRDVILRMQELGMKVVVLVSASAFDYDDPSNALAQDDGSGAFKAKCGWDGGAFRVAYMNTQKYKQRIQMHLDRYKAAGINNIIGFEILNELDWVCFNGDIWIGGVDVFNTDMITKYAELLKVSNQTIKKAYPNAKIVTAGLANIGLTVPNYRGYIYPLNFLKWVNSVKDESGKGAIDAYADAIGVHWYPMDFQNFQNTTQDMLDKVSGSYGSGTKPIWITEYGVSDYLTTDQQLRKSFFKNFYVFLRDVVKSVHVQMVFAYGLHTPDGHDFVDYKDPSIVGSVPASCVADFYPSLIPANCEDKIRPAMSIFAEY